jgi:hypothetical protein
MSGHNSGTPAAISTKLDTHIAICMCKNLMYLKVGCLHPVACTTSGSGFQSNATLV